MPLESATFIQSLDINNPPGTDPKSQGDDHLRLLKSVLKSTFPTASKAFYSPDTIGKSADFVVVAADMNKTFIVDTSGGSRTATLPTLVSGDAGWECFFLKSSGDVNALFVAPASGTLTSGDIPGLAKTRRAIPNRRFRAFWTGSVWFIERSVDLPVGTIIDCPRSILPVGYEWANGQTLSSVNYPDYNAAVGTTTPDRRGRVAAGRDDMGGSSANRLTTYGVDGDVLGAAGGSESHTLTSDEMPSHTHTVTDPGHIHALANGGSVTSGTTPNAGAGGSVAGALTSIASATTGITNQNTGGGLAHSSVQPTMITNMVVVVE